MTRSATIKRLAAPIAISLAALGALSFALLSSTQAAQGPADAGIAALPTSAVAQRAISAQDLAQLQDGLSAASRGDWDSVRNARGAAGDPLVRKILLWRYASDQAAPSLFEEVEGALRQLPGWSKEGVMRRKAEQLIFDSGFDPQRRIAFLRQNNGPVSGDGRIALAQALARTGQRTEANAIAREAWRGAALTPRAADIAADGFGESFTASDYAARANGALWRDDRGLAASLLPKLTRADRAIVQARIALQTQRSRGLQALVDAAGDVRADDPGLLYDRARYVRRTGRPDDALNIIARVDPAQAPVVAQEPLNEERRLYVLRALRSGQPRTAYKLAALHQLSRSTAFAESEWLAGFIAFRFLKEPETAKRHFTRLRENVSTPVSVARAAYWLGRVAQSQGDAPGAAAFFQEAAGFPFTYYGQLALEIQDPNAQLAFGPLSAPTQTEIDGFEAREQVQALRLIARVGDQDDFEAIAFGLDDQLATPFEYEQLSSLAREQGFIKSSVRSAKAGLARGILAPEAAYPIITVPQSAQGYGRAEPALIHGVIRQETEFDAQARSSAGARGLMQLLPSTAAAVARRNGVPYSTAHLFDRDTNLTLGSIYLQSRIEEFGGSYILALAAYNAGPSRVSQWLSDWGDPRTGSIDPIDWVELIPFEETRNYVQRVMENTQIYRNKLSQSPTPLRLSKDLRRGGSG
jgi:soluble lytic murein transglycosylase